MLLLEHGQDFIPFISLLVDFNIVLNPSEKCGGVWHNALQRKISHFWNCSRLIDLGFVGIRHTCSNQQGNCRRVARLDRAYANSLWTHLFPSTVVHHLKYKTHAFGSNVLVVVHLWTKPGDLCLILLVPNYDMYGI